MSNALLAEKILTRMSTVSGYKVHNCQLSVLHRKFTVSINRFSTGSIAKCYRLGHFYNALIKLVTPCLRAMNKCSYRKKESKALGQYFPRQILLKITVLVLM